MCVCVWGGLRGEGGRNTINNLTLENRDNKITISPKSICCGYSLEAPLKGASNEYPQHMLLEKSGKKSNTFG